LLCRFKRFGAANPFIFGEIKRRASPGEGSMSGSKRFDRLTWWVGIYGAIGVLLVALSLLTSPTPLHALAVGVLMVAAGVGLSLKRRLGYWLTIALVPPGLVFSLYTLGSVLVLGELATAAAVAVLLVLCAIMVLLTPFLLSSKRSEFR
jgi:hypothetical protein